ncbi:hypothetical protein ACFSX9_08350 [Flavobacterium ardleyense]|uniref:Secreted protein n=1 Tax=Flavobacterium ardleyense TaxID=2038737 RepID=A0ABW5Z9H6_9FLAO
MLRKLNLSIIFAFVLSLNMFSQTTSTTTSGSTKFDINQFHGIVAEPKGSSVQGSQYYQEEFLDAHISVVNNQIVAVRYNVVNDEMEFERGGQVLQMYKTDSLTVSFLKINKVFKVVEYDFKGQTNKGFLIANTQNDKVNFFMKEVITYVPFKDALSSYTQPVSAHYRKDKNAYFIEINNKITEMPNKKKSLLKLFPNNVDAIEKFLKTYKTDFDSKSDLITLTNFLNKL